MDKKIAKAAQWKKDKVYLINNLTKKYKTIGIIDTTNLPSSQMQKMRANLTDKGMVLLMTRSRLIKLALKDSKKNIDQIINKIRGIPAIIFLNESAFNLIKFISKNKSAATAKPGQIAPFDLYVPAGPTPFTPGPVIGELGQLGIKTAIEAGKISIKEATRIVKQNEVISEKAAGILSKLGIQPMEIGMNLIAIYEEGIIYEGDVLRLNEEEYIDNIKKAHHSALNLALNLAIPIKEVISILIKKAYIENVALSSKIKFEVNKEIKPLIKTKEEKFKEEEDVASNILSNLQDQKIKHRKT